MKRIFILSVISLVLFSGCENVVNNIPQEDLPKENPVIEEPKTEEPKTSENSTFKIESANLEVTLPSQYSYTEDQETGRRGSFASGRFVSVSSKYDGFDLQEMFLFNENSVDTYNKTCGTPDNLCFEGNYPTLEEFKNMKKSFEEISDYKNFHLFVFNDRNFYVTNFSCTGDSCMIRQYTTFVGENRIDFWINMKDDTFQEQADKLFEKILFENIK